jgi:hypothetical protein
MIFLCCNQIYKSFSFFRNSIKESVYSNKLFHNKNSKNNENVYNKLVCNKSNYIQKIVFIKSNIIFPIYTNLFNEKTNEYFYHSMEIKNFITMKIADKKNLHISPGGLYGFYDYAICEYVKQNYILSDYIFSGVSAGAWNSLIMTYKYNNLSIDKIFEKVKNKEINSIKKMQFELKKFLLENSNSEDYELDKLFITVCVIENNTIRNYIYTDFTSLENAIDCCIASSNIPFITGDIFYKFENKLSYDGGFLKNQQIIIKQPNLIISNDIFGKKRKITSLFDSKNNVIDLYEEGKYDCENNTVKLNDIL